MTKDHKGRLLCFRKGDRSEYLSLYFISRFAYIIPVPRQEDFGFADFICFLGKENKPYLYAENAFFIQAKSTNKKSFIFKEDSTNFLKYHSDLPLLVLFIDESDGIVRLYSSWRLWYSLSLFDLKEINKISIVTNKYIFKGTGKIYNLSKKGRLQITLHKPIIEINQDKIDKYSDSIYNILKFWLELERLNLIALRTNKTIFYGVKEWEPNHQPSDTNIEKYYTIGQDNFYQPTADSLTSLCLNLAHKKQSQKENIKSVSKVMKLIPEKYFDDHGKKFRKS